VLLARRDRIEAELEQLASESIFAKPIARLRCLRGINTLSALGICAEVGQFERFDHPDSPAAYLGIVPSENTTGQHRRQGSITKTGSTHARRLLIEAAYDYQHAPPTARRSSAAKKASRRTSSTSPGAPSEDSTPAGGSSNTSATNPTASSRSRSPANWPASAGRSRWRGAPAGRGGSAGA